MKTAVLPLLSWLGCYLGMAAEPERRFPEPWLPRPGMVGNWDAVSERFTKWKIDEFEFGGAVADGGSLIFDFKTVDGSEFEILVACSAWWTKQDWKKKRQPIFLLHGEKAYGVSKGSEHERILLLKLKGAASRLKGLGRKRPIYIERLHDLVASRAISDNFWPFGDLDLNGEPGSWNERRHTVRQHRWPFDRLDLDGASGDWSKILGRFKKWEIVDFSEWDYLGDGSTIFKFTTSDAAELGVLVPTTEPYYPNTDDPFDQGKPVIFPQPIYVHFDRQLYLVENGGEIETALLAKLSSAAKELKGKGILHPKYIECLGAVVESRKIPPYDDWPFDHLHLDASEGVALPPSTGGRRGSTGG